MARVNVKALGFAAVLSFALVLWGQTQAAITLDFETEDDFTTPLVHGQDISTPPEFGNWVIISSSGAGHLGPAIFDSTNGPFGTDPDLNVGLGNILILQDSSSPTQTTSGIFDAPNDAASGGTIIFDFVSPAYLLSINLVDIDSGAQTTVTLTDGGGSTRVYNVPNDWTGEKSMTLAGWHTLDLTTLAPQPGPGTGGNATATDYGLNPSDVRRLEVQFSGSAGVDGLVFIPEPATMLLAGLGFAVLALRFRKRR